MKGGGKTKAEGMMKKGGEKIKAKRVKL